MDSDPDTIAVTIIAFFVGLTVLIALLTYLDPTRGQDPRSRRDHPEHEALRPVRRRLVPTTAAAMVSRIARFFDRSGGRGGAPPD